jgi:hypothetical protein
MAEIRESRLIRIQDCVIMTKDLHKLARLVDKEYTNRKSLDENASVSFSATCDDQSVFESEDITLFDEESILSSKRVTSVKMKYNSYRTNSYLEIDIRHAKSSLIGPDNTFGNEITVRGTDTKWVNGTLRNLEEIIAGFKPQNTFFRRKRLVLAIIFSISIGAIIGRLLMLLVSLVKSPATSTASSSPLIQYPIAVYILSYSIYGMLGIFPTLFLMDKFLSLWPTVEIQIGPAHKLIEKRRRIWISNVILFGLLPLLISLVYDILKGVANH